MRSSAVSRRHTPGRSFRLWPPLLLASVAGLMMLGGCGGSTSKPTGATRPTATQQAASIPVLTDNASCAQWFTASRLSKTAYADYVALRLKEEGYPIAHPESTVESEITYFCYPAVKYPQVAANTESLPTTIGQAVQSMGG